MLLVATPLSQTPKFSFKFHSFYHFILEDALKIFESWTVATSKVDWDITSLHSSLLNSFNNFSLNP